MTTPSSSTPRFAACAIASGLVSQEEVAQIVQGMRAARQDPQYVPGDAELAEVLTASGRMNRWQASQLLGGRTKFTLGAYHILDAIGRGGMGHVFLAEHSVMGRKVAVKVLPRHKSTPEAVAGFGREVRTQAQLDHENLVRAHDAGHEGNVHFLVTEYVPGMDLRKLVRSKGPLSMRQAATIISQAARGLDYAHRQGLIHRDIKPGNILVTPEGKTKVSDLGLAAWFESDEAADEAARQNKIVGTADYIAPELFRNPGSASTAADIYALGCTLYYSVTGKVPYPGGGWREKRVAHCTKRPIDPRRLNPRLSPEFCSTIGLLMARNPQERPASALEVVRLLAPWADPAFAPTVQAAPVPRGKPRKPDLFDESPHRGPQRLSAPPVAPPPPRAESPEKAARQAETAAAEADDDSSGNAPADGSTVPGTYAETRLSDPYDDFGDDEDYVVPPLLQLLIVFGGVWLLLLLVAALYLTWTATPLDSLLRS